eukprot:5435933-Lingulodinium_polyedra.AAC.1
MHHAPRRPVRRRPWPEQRWQALQFHGVRDFLGVDVVEEFVGDPENVCGVEARNLRRLGGAATEECGALGPAGAG